MRRAKELRAVKEAVAEFNINQNKINTKGYIMKKINAVSCNPPYVAKQIINEFMWTIIDNCCGTGALSKETSKGIMDKCCGRDMFVYSLFAPNIDEVHTSEPEMCIC